MKKTTAITLCSAAMLLTSALPGNAQTFSFGQSTAKWANACGNDVAKYCKVLKLNNNEFVACLTNYASPACRTATQDFIYNRDARLHDQAGVVKHCKSDAKRLCSGFKEGQGRVLKCLTRRGHFRKVTKNCKAWLKSAGWLDPIAKRAN